MCIYVWMFYLKHNHLLAFFFGDSSMNIIGTTFAFVINNNNKSAANFKWRRVWWHSWLVLSPIPTSAKTVVSFFLHLLYSQMIFSTMILSSWKLMWGALSLSNSQCSLSPSPPLPLSLPSSSCLPVSLFSSLSLYISLWVLSCNFILCLSLFFFKGKFTVGRLWAACDLISLANATNTPHSSDTIFLDEVTINALDVQSGHFVKCRHCKYPRTSWCALSFSPLFTSQWWECQNTTCYSCTYVHSCGVMAPLHLVLSLIRSLPCALVLCLSNHLSPDLAIQGLGCAHQSTSGKDLAKETCGPARLCAPAQQGRHLALFSIYSLWVREMFLNEQTISTWWACAFFQKKKKKEREREIILLYARPQSAPDLECGWISGDTILAVDSRNPPLYVACLWTMCFIIPLRL